MKIEGTRIFQFGGETYCNCKDAWHEGFDCGRMVFVKGKCDFCKGGHFMFGGPL